MRLNLDCIRSVLLYTESEQAVCDRHVEAIFIEQYLRANELSSFGQDEIVYSIRQMKKSGLLSVSIFDYSEGAEIAVNDITPEGHEFLANIRDNSTWKSIVRSVGEMALSLVIEYAAAYSRKLIGLP